MVRIINWEVLALVAYEIRKVFVKKVTRGGEVTGASSWIVWVKLSMVGVGVDMFVF